MQIFDTLVRPEDGTFAVTPGDFKPSPAESWTSSADGRTWTFQLHKGVRFHGGYGEVTADNVGTTFERLLDPRRPSIASRCTPEPWRASPPKVRAASPSSSSGPIRCSAAASSLPVAAASSPGRHRRNAAAASHKSDRHQRLPTRPDRPRQGRVPQGIRRALGGPAGHHGAAVPLHPRYDGAHAGAADGPGGHDRGSAGAGLDSIDPGPQEGVCCST